MNSVKEAFEYLKSKPKYAFMWDTDSMDAMIGQSCDIIEVKKHTIDLNRWVMYMRKGYPYKNLFNHLLVFREKFCSMGVYIAMSWGLMAESEKLSFPTLIMKPISIF